MADTVMLSNMLIHVASYEGSAQRVRHTHVLLERKSSHTASGMCCIAL